ncbi:hypothetical protein Hanom_Chr07g00673951 [Helianthus anomalus]
MSWLTRPLHASSCNTNVLFSPCSCQRATRTPNHYCDINHAPTPHSLITRPIYHPLSKTDLINPKSVLAVWGTFGAIITHGSSSYLINQLQFTQKKGLFRFQDSLQTCEMGSIYLVQKQKNISMANKGETVMKHAFLADLKDTRFFDSTKRHLFENAM